MCVLKNQAKQFNSVKLQFWQKLSYEERMARRLLGPDNATYMFDQDNLSDSQLDQVRQKTVIELVDIIIITNIIPSQHF